MTSYENPWTGKPVDKISDLLPHPNGQTCDECGSPCIDNCLKCGAPQCCPSCCYEETPSARITGDKGRENPAEGAPYGEGLIGRITQLEMVNAQLIKALQEQIAECFDDLCEMCAVHEVIISAALEGDRHE